MGELRPDHSLTVHRKHSIAAGGERFPEPNGLEALSRESRRAHTADPKLSEPALGWERLLRR